MILPQKAFSDTILYLDMDSLLKNLEIFQGLVAKNVKIMAISVHPYLTGVPHRILFFEKLLDYILEHKDVEIMTGRNIHDWYTHQVKK